MHKRKNARQQWLEKNLNTENFVLAPLTGDASFRHYLRLSYNNIQRIVMDAPPEKESVASFLAVNNYLRAHGLRCPEVFLVDEAQGFMVLEDFGDNLLLNLLTASTADKFYQQALLTLNNLQQIPTTSWLPLFNQSFMQQELALFKEWFLEKYLNLSLAPTEQTMLTDSLQWLVEKISEQPQVLIHRDYHSRNLMVLNLSDSIELGIIDFQDAMIGPLTYDLVSLLKDCYIQWPQEKINQWVTFFYERSLLAQQFSLRQFVNAFHLCGLQRHLKVLGIFSRLHLRDNKSSYLKDLPLTLHYVRDCTERFEELQPVYRVLQRITLP